ncbi:hypothetical protein ACE6H2_017520 [Prunus campanulata]
MLFGRWIRFTFLLTPRPLLCSRSLTTDPTSPPLFSSTDQPCSPLWGFPEGDADNDDKLAGQVDQALSDSPQFSSSLRQLKELTDQHVLAQFWAPVKNGGRYVLTTSGQPFVLDPHTNGLHQYRMASLMYMFSVDGEGDGMVGLPGRVFQQKLPEWTPNVQYSLHQRVSTAWSVFKPSGRSCVGVLELIMTSPKINYASEVDKVCKALEHGEQPRPQPKQGTKIDKVYGHQH